MERQKTTIDITPSILKNKADAFLMIGDSHDADMYYATRFFASDSFTYLQTKDADEILFISEMERGRAEMESRISDIRTTNEYDYKSKVKARGDPALGYVDCLAELLQKEDIRKIAVPRHFPLFTAQTLKEEGFTVIPIKSPLREMRMKKDETEIEHITSVQDACETAMQSAIDMIKNAIVTDGVLYYNGYTMTSEHIRAEIEHKLLDMGCEADSTIVACGKQSANPHWEGEGAIMENEPIVIDIFPRNKKSRYYADMSRTVLKGKPSKELADMYSAVIAAQDAAFALIKIGVKCGDIHNAVCDAFEDLGYDTIRNDSKVGFIHSTGHGVGLDIHEFPNVGDNDSLLEEGNVITIEPGLYDPDVGGIRIEDMVVVTKNGYTNLTRFEKDFVV
ncbi:MAG TPA: aminopeptidase P family protein [Methanosarcinaceae archaeon]|nr:aminopeptidase P family protein [Methanosarcinaceae archaeon]